MTSAFLNPVMIGKNGFKLHVWYTEIGSSISCYETLWAQYRPEFPAALRERVESFRNWQDRLLNLLGKLLVCRALEQYGTVRDILGAYTQAPDGRPFVNLPGVPDFNISHSGKYAVCAAISGAGRVGIDIELQCEVDLAGFESFLPISAWRLIMQAGGRFEEFYRFWTMCESVAKAQGCGVCGQLRDIELHDGMASFCGQSWAVKEIEIAQQYSCHVACNMALPADIEAVRTLLVC